MITIKTKKPQKKLNKKILINAEIYNNLINGSINFDLTVPVIIGKIRAIDLTENTDVFNIYYQENNVTVSVEKNSRQYLVSITYPNKDSSKDTVCMIMRQILKQGGREISGEN